MNQLPQDATYIQHTVKNETDDEVRAAETDAKHKTATIAGTIGALGKDPPKAHLCVIFPQQYMKMV